LCDDDQLLFHIPAGARNKRFAGGLKVIKPGKESGNDIRRPGPERVSGSFGKDIHNICLGHRFNLDILKLDDYFDIFGFVSDIFLWNCGFMTGGQDLERLIVPLLDDRIPRDRPQTTMLLHHDQEFIAF